MALDVDAIRRVTAKWDDFPVTREPRPIVLTQLTPTAWQQELERTPWQAYFDDPAAVFEQAPPAWFPGTLREFFGGRRIVPPETWGPMVRGPAPFATDRGVRRLPAWWLRHPDTGGAWFGPDAQFLRTQTWRPPGLDQDAGSPEESRLAPDGRTLTYRFLGHPDLYADYPHADVFETETIVAVQPVRVSVGKPGGLQLPFMQEREVTVQLAASLGNRVLVNVDLGGGSEDAFNALPRTVIVE